MGMNRHINRGGNTEGFQRVKPNVNPSQKSRPAKPHPNAPPKACSPVMTFKLGEEQLVLRAQIMGLFPDVFDLANPKPLALNMHKELKSTLREKGIIFNKALLKDVITHWCGSLKYKQAVIQSKYRYNLRGEISEEVAISHKEDSLTAMKYFLHVYNYIKEKEAAKARKKK